MGKWSKCLHKVAILFRKLRKYVKTSNKSRKCKGDFLKDDEISKDKRKTKESQHVVAEKCDREGISTEEHGVGKEQVILALDFDLGQTTMGDIISNLRQFGSIVSEYWGKTTSDMSIGLFKIDKCDADMVSSVISKNAEKFDQLGVKKILLIDSTHKSYIREDGDSVSPYDDDKGTIHKLKEQTNDRKYQLPKTEVQITELRNKLQVTDEKTTDTDKGVAVESPIDSDKYGRNKGGHDIGQLQKERKMPLTDESNGLNVSGPLQELMTGNDRGSKIIAGVLAGDTAAAGQDKP
uniref:Uncharacterized protein LOC102801457 n=1 Tax=Saccoglossus kowalevskii TaxID=10224 RepID=A0ABM0LUD3_SACKO|nr:PREDICTED: uncharacterized protein LOC102801457 [Saccoglossus kowalevskii]